MALGHDLLRLLHALNKYQTWHSPGFLAEKGLIDPEWSRAYFDALGADLEREGFVESRMSETKGLMYQITISGTKEARRARESAGRLGQPA